MTFYDAAKIMGKRPCVIVQLFMSRCANQFGVAPCTAVGSGNTKCFRSRSSCRDVPNYAETDEWVFNFSTTRVSGFQEIDQSPVFPTVTNIETASTILTPGKGLGARASVNITLQDFPWTDVYSDPYRLERTGTPPGDIGTFWGKFLARHRYHENRRIVIHTGFLTASGEYDPDNFQTRTYFITNISGPDGEGKVTLEAKDPIKFSDNDKSQFPKGYQTVLNADINDVQTTLVVRDVSGELLDVGPITIAGQKYIKVDSEIMKVTGISPAFPSVGVPGATYTLTVVRGPGPTAMPAYYQAATNEGSDHNAGSTVQPCYEWDAVSVAYIIYQLFIESGVDPAYIEPAATWQADFVDSGLGDYAFTNLLVKPEGIKTLLDEIAQHNILIWWDERAQLIKCRALVFRSALNSSYNETQNIIQGSQIIAEVTKDRLTQVWMLFNVINPTYDLKKQVSYETINIIADLSLETPEKYGQSGVSFIYSRWLEQGLDISSQVCSRRLQRFQDPYHIYTFEVDPKDSQYWVGDNLALQSSLYQDEFGNQRRVNYLITQADEIIGSEGVRYRFTAVEQVTYGGITAAWTPVPGVTIPSGLPLEGETMPADYDSATQAQREAYAFWGYDDGEFADGTKSYVWV
jgi:hypothetical protein